MPEIRVIQATKGPLADKLPVAAYCRVSSNSEDQRHSFVAQVREYTARITENPKWALAGIYSDKGITGTSARKRPEFQRLMEDCRQGNGNGFVLGVSGSGKSFVAKREMLNLALAGRDDDILVVDPENEYAGIVRELGGEVIRIAATSRNHINAMDMVEG